MQEGKDFVLFYPHDFHYWMALASKLNIGAYSCKVSARFQEYRTSKVKLHGKRLFVKNY